MEFCSTSEVWLHSQVGGRRQAGWVLQPEVNSREGVNDGMAARLLIRIPRATTEQCVHADVSGCITFRAAVADEKHVGWSTRLVPLCAVAFWAERGGCVVVV